MKAQSEYKLRKRIAELEAENTKLGNELTVYRWTVQEIFDGIASIENGTIRWQWVLTKIRRCLR